MKNLRLQRRVYFAVLGIPANLRHLYDGQTTLVKTTGTGDYRTAAARKDIIVGKWKEEFAQGRQGLTMTRDHKLLRLGQNYREAALAGDTDKALGLLLNGLPLLGQVNGEQLWTMFRDGQGDVAKVLANLPEPAVVETIITRRTPFSAHLEQWRQETEVSGKSLAQAIMATRKFLENNSEPIETLAKPHVQQFIVCLRRSNLSNGTIRNYLTGIRGYWEWMIGHGIVTGANPFAGHKQRRMKRPNKKPERIGFTVPDILRLLEQAANDVWLWRLIEIARFTGARRESICDLTVADIETVDGIQCFHFDDKSEAGNRYTPVHSALKPLISKMVECAENGRLFHGMKPNKWGHCSDAIGKRFSKLKTSVGFGRDLTFHSIRYTVIHLFQKAKIPEFIAADIVGHDKPTMTYGLYGGISEVKAKQGALEEALIYAATT